MDETPFALDAAVFGTIGRSGGPFRFGGLVARTGLT
jgi:hypothetical protein